MIERKTLINTIKRALQTGSFNFIGQDVKQIPKELFHIDEINFEDQNWWQCLPITKIDASNNEIIRMPEQICNLPDIQLIRLKNNKITTLHINTLGLKMIKVIDLNKNCINELPQQLSFNRTLVELNFAQNMIEYCPDLSQIETLENFFINDNRLKQLPDFGKGLKKLQASNNKIRYVRKYNFFLCNQLENINLNKNQIQQIQQGSFSKASNLIILEIKENRLNTFEEIPKSQKLDTINLAFNNLKEYNYFENSPNLTVLILSNNKITKISKDIMKLQKIKTLDLQNNDLSQLPCEIGFINSLVRLQVEGNPLKTIRQNIRNGGTNILKKYLKDRMAPQEQSALDKKFGSPFQNQSNEKEHWIKLINEFSQGGELILRNMKLTELDSLAYGRNLKGLNLSDNQIKQLSDEIANLTQLKYLILNKNVLESLPATLGTIPTLQSIEAKNNRLSTFGSIKNHSFNKYPVLKHLDLSGNRFIQVPRTILLMNSLRTLYISYNQIRSIDDVWLKGNIPRLEILDASNNALTDLSDEVYYKPGLNFLNIENNSLTKIPTLLGFMKLSSLKVDGNPLKLIKRAVIDKGTIALMEFLRTKHMGEIPQPIQAPIEEKIEIEESLEKWPYTQKVGQRQTINQAPIKASQHQFPLKPTTQQYRQQQIPQQIPQQNMPFKQPQKTQQKVNTQQTNFRIKQIEKQINQIQYELQNNYSLNNVKKNEKRKQAQSLMIEKNKLVKDRDGYC